MSWAMCSCIFKRLTLPGNRSTSKNVSIVPVVLGENDLRVPLYDYETGGCCDGLKKDGVNRNLGAESTLAYLISYLTVLKALEYEL